MEVMSVMRLVVPINLRKVTFVHYFTVIRTILTREKFQTSSVLIGVYILHKIVPRSKCEFLNENNKTKQERFLSQNKDVCVITDVHLL